MKKYFLSGLLLVLSLLALGGVVQAGEAPYPNKPIRLVVPYPPGGGNDTIGRALGQSISEALGVTVIIENRPGANGSIATEFVARAEPDGHTLLMANNGSHGINPSLYKAIKYDPIGDFSPIALVATSPNVLVVSPALNVRTIQEFIAYARNHPGSLTFGSNGSGSSQHMAGALFASTFGLEMMHIPYKGTGPMMTDLLGGRISASFGNIVAVLPHIRAGRLVALAVTTPTRSDALPDVPAVAETVPGFDATVWWALVTTKNAPQQAVAQLAREVKLFDEKPSTKILMETVGAQPSASTPAELGSFIRSELKKWALVIEQTGATAD